MFKHAQTHFNEELSQMAAAEFMASSAYDRHLRRLRGLLRNQRQRTAEAITAYFPAGTRLNDPDGGMTLWVELADKLSSQRLFDSALAEGILIAPGLMFSNSNRFEHFVRINCGWPYTDAVDSALKRLGQLCHQLSQDAV
jgi:DNA-binding transcriptional MocR family regulator